MKKSIPSMLGLLGLAALVIMTSCSPMTEENTEPQLVNKTEVLIAAESYGDFYARKSAGVAYFERFTNKLSQVDENGNFTPGLPAYFPGYGVGNSSHMGKAYTFLNQFASFGAEGLGSVGAPVTQFYSDELESLGIVVDNHEVSSVTTDGKGNSVWFKNVKNQVTIVGDERNNFVADVEIVGGTGKFEGASGTATVNGFFNPKNGQGMSTIHGKILF